MATKWCPGYTSDGSAGETYDQPRHELDADPAANNFGPGKSQCRTCYGVYARDWRAKRNVGGAPSTRSRRATATRPTIILPDLRVRAGDAEAGDDDERVSDEDLALGSHAYVPSLELIETWGAVSAAAAAGRPAANMLFLGPKGCGKTEGADYLAGTVGLPFIKIDSASMTDPESWFGTREVVEGEHGSSITTYRPSTFVLGLEQACVMLLDEINRANDWARNVLLPVLDKTRRVTNPLTGDVIYRHPRCFIVMSGNRGLSFTGTYAIDPAFISRSLTIGFDYVDQVSEIQIAKDSTGCDDEIASLFVRFAAETRTRAKMDPDFEPVSTREVMEACDLVVRGASPDTAARVTVINAASPEGGPSSYQSALDTIWTGIRKAPAGQLMRPCGVKHPWATDPQGDVVVCVKGVPLSTPDGANGHAADPQHRGSEMADGTLGEAWFDQP